MQICNAMHLKSKRGGGTLKALEEKLRAKIEI